MQEIDKETAHSLKELKSSSSNEERLLCALDLKCNAQTIDRYLNGKGTNGLTAKAIVSFLKSKQTQTA